MTDEQAVTVTPYVVNTMTVTAHIGRNKIDLGRLAEEQASLVDGASAPEALGIPRISHFSYRNGKDIVRVGRVLKRNGRERRYSSKLFDK